MAAFIAAAAVLSAQAPAPGVRIVRDASLNDRVWPADLNGDGRADLISSTQQRCSGGTCTGPNLQVSLGRGNGTFAVPVQSSFVGHVLNTTDVNRDGRRDVIAETPGSGTRSIAVLPGTGTASLGAPVPVSTFAFDQFSFAASGDFNQDGKRDLVLPHADGIAVHAGRGDFTFDTPVPITTPSSVADAIVADLNNDGRSDIVTANLIDSSVTVVLNRGGLVFSMTEIRFGYWATDVTASDVNRDGRLDLLVSAGRSDHSFGFGEGFAFVLLNSGNGKFGTPTRYDLPNGPTQVVAADANRDGIVDLITGNQSAMVRDDCGVDSKGWDSISVLLGTGDGGFDGPWNFSIGDQSLVDPADPNFFRFKNRLKSLNTADLDGDGRTDLIASFGALVFNSPAAANRAPAVDFGPDIVLDHPSEISLQPRASDPDEDMLTWEVRDETGRLIANYPTICRQMGQGRHTLTVTVYDGHGNSASDGIVVTVGSGEDGGVLGFRQDIGNVAAAGFDSYDNSTGTYTIQASGADIWGTADAFRFVSTVLLDDFTIAARVDSVQNVHAWTKAGLMVRENTTPGSRHISLFATPGKGLAFQRRTSTNGTSLTSAASLETAPAWLQISRRGNVVYAYWRKEADQFWTLAGQQAFTSLPRALYAGLAVTSHQDGSLARAVFSDVFVSQIPWTGRAIGGTGTSSENGAVFNVSGRGADIWNTSDAFYYLHTIASGRFSLTARVRSLTNTHAWAKAGVMIRESLAADARHAFALVTPGKGVSFQYRPQPGGQTLQVTPGGGAAPAWLRIVRDGDRIDAAWSTNGETWTRLGNVSIPMSDAVFIGLPVTSHNTGATAAAVFDDVRITPF